LHGLSFVHNELFCVRTAADDSHYFVANFPRAYSRTDGGHMSRELHSRNFVLTRKRVWIKAHSLQQVCAIQTRCSNLHRYFFWAWLRRRDVGNC
jgi:hypothetical protein